jgi:hypothetical protein
MFTSIVKFQDEQFFKEHEDGVIYFGNQRMELDIVAFGIIRADNRAVYNLGSDAVDAIMSEAIRAREKGKGRYILLSTCDAHQKSMRDVLLVRIRD